jgi:hypothetical protein
MLTQMPIVLSKIECLCIVNLLFELYFIVLVTPHGQGFGDLTPIRILFTCLEHPSFEVGYVKAVINTCKMRKLLVLQVI